MASLVEKESLAGEEDFFLLLMVRRRNNSYLQNPLYFYCSPSTSYQKFQLNLRKYFEFEGQGIFVVSNNNVDDVYLSIGASKVLNMPAGKKLSSTEVITQMKKHISNLQ